MDPLNLPPLRIDLFSVFIFLGLMQAIYLGLVYVVFPAKRTQSSVLQGLLLWSMGGFLLEIFLMYSGLIPHAWFLVDFSEPLGFLIGPLFYGVILCLTRGTVPAKYWIHGVPFFAYTLYMVPFWALPDVAKYNAWIAAYHPDLPRLDYSYPYPTDPLLIREFITPVTLFSVAVYGLLCLRAVFGFFSSQNASIWKPVTEAQKRLRLVPFILVTVFIFVTVVKIFNMEDTGDHWYAAYIAFTVYLTSFLHIRSSNLEYADLKIPEKYQSSRLDAETQRELIDRVKQILERNQPYLHPDFSLPNLAKEAKTSVHVLSQAINEGFGKTFFELTAEYRVREACRLLKGEEGAYLKMEEIAERVGYSSKSSFNTVFKKQVGMTPSEYRKSAQNGIV
ncbi:transcriptional regulator araC family [Mariniradius saccharolyticus AK6]|uniref:Transcriptional regulator araC family n=1 Tax=Mariniradius saccharolyticus AK6 TaxID=1239962 RepID=M7Y0T4_9BACT|nr:AraC family transcriptional regulator [Mariniradius saccharolyticus]EMS34332.1 transcriptional regulator araC family [Mariniradius saccharolyticus AK6]